MEPSDKLSKSAFAAISNENLEKKPLCDYKMTDAQRENWIRWAEYVHRYKKQTKKYDLTLKSLNYE